MISKGEDLHNIIMKLDAHLFSKNNVVIIIIILK